MRYTSASYDAVVIGGGHAGCEAALALARMGKRTALFAINLDSVAMMPCNPNIGGTSKGHLVREVDALGGEMGRNIDKTYIQSRMLNTGKGPAVFSLRAQADKRRYSNEMRRVLERTENLELIQAEIVDIITENGGISAVVASGTYLNSRCLCGETINYCGPNGLRAAKGLSAALSRLGVGLMRFKTGTPARLDARSVDFSKMTEQKGDAKITPFSFENGEEDIRREQLSCWLTYTNARTHEIIRENIGRSPMYSGLIEGTGTRYCPSIEDKVVRFADREGHQVFIEPEGEDSAELYVGGMSTSLPLDVQEKMYRSVEGLENCRITRNGYAIEYDCMDATELRLSLEHKRIRGLFFAGQINGSSGYEEAAAQGIVAGINAALLLSGREPMLIDRSEGYVGVLIDDLVTKGTKEPYRMMTSRAEYRLALRQDNADLRLTERGYRAGLISGERYAKFLKKRGEIDAETDRVQKINITPTAAVNALLSEYGSEAITTGIRLADLIKRPELDYDKLEPIDRERPEYGEAVREQVNISIKFEGYIKRQNRQIEQFKKMEARSLPPDLDFDAVPNLRAEARQKLTRLRPSSVGHASRISGVSPADITMLLVYLKGKS